MFISKLNFKYILLTVLMAILAVFLKKYRSENLSFDSRKADRVVLSSDELAKYNGVDIDKLYLSVIGSIFDVTDGKTHYAKGSPYHYFIGKDGTRSLVTGDFKDESSNKDNVLDLSCDDLLQIINWRQTFRVKYKYIGSLAGRYYDKNGEETVYMTQLKQRIKNCKQEKEEAKKQDQIYPPCNIAWSEKDGTRVWCTKTSGGINRNWEGVPRQLFTPGEKRPRCVCVNLEKVDSSLLKEYEGCSSSSKECSVNN
ncbi:neuferricin homolog [Melitaea cinxia]|uniref:neuferricin homolog n=1 Tax=Melitaea cinxia TaxID=113334 RepID=UPI001E2716F6|nr:neuferricin homolog [Melitaea cinxia]XP_045445390.1 neuferricin homolog [Melitaea cinxia]